MYLTQNVGVASVDATAGTVCIACTIRIIALQNQGGGWLLWGPLQTARGVPEASPLHDDSETKLASGTHSYPELLQAPYVLLRLGSGL